MAFKVKTKTGPEPERLKIEGDWKQAIGKAIKKPRPVGGWPKPTPKAAKKPKG